MGLFHLGDGQLDIGHKGAKGSIGVKACKDRLALLFVGRLQLM
jgi:hypothetical protein